MKKLISFILITALSFPLAACYDNREIDQTAYIIAVGIDKHKGKYNYTFQISSPLAMGSGGEAPSLSQDETSNTRVENIVINADSLYEARNSLNCFLSKTPNFSHLKIIVFSAAAAKEGLSKHIPFLLNEREVRPNTNICISEATAEAFLSAINPALEANTAEYYDLVIKNSSALAPPKTLRELINEQSMLASAVPMGKISPYNSSNEFPSSSESPLHLSPSKSEFSGLFLLKDNKAAGTLSPLQSCIYGLLTNKTNTADITVSKNGEAQMVRLKLLSPAKFTLKSTPNSTTIKLCASFFAEVNSFNPSISQKDIEEYLTTEACALFMTARESGCDIFGVGNSLMKNCDTVDQWEALNHNEIFKNSYFAPSISVFIERSNFGTM